MFPITYDNDIQKLSGWGCHKGKEGNVASAAPAITSMKVDPVTGYATFDIEGPSTPPNEVAGAEYYKARPIPAGASNLNLTYIFTVDSNHASQCNSDENDCIFTIPDPNKPTVDMNLNGSVQNNNAEGGELQISNAASGWINTGIFPGVYTSGPVHKLEVLYSINRAKGAVTVAGFIFDEAFFPVALNLSVIAGADKGWGDTDEVMVQLQQMLKVNGTKYTIVYQHVNLTWS